MTDEAGSPALTASQRLALRQEQDAKRAEEKRIADKEAAAERELANLDVWDAAVAKYGDKHVARADVVGQMFILRTPTMAEHMTFQKGLQRKEPLEATDKLVRSTVIHPSKPEFDRLVDEWPGLCIELGDIATDLDAITGTARKKG